MVGRSCLTGTCAAGSIASLQNIVSKVVEQGADRRSHGLLWPPPMDSEREAALNHIVQQPRDGGTDRDTIVEVILAQIAGLEQRDDGLGGNSDVSLGHDVNRRS
jgi:hypothetical protein